MESQLWILNLVAFFLVVTMLKVAEVAAAEEIKRSLQSRRC